VLQEIAKLERIHQLGLPADLFAQVSAKTLDSFRNRIAVEDLQEVRRHPDPIRFTLLAGYCWRRLQEIVDTLVELLLDVAHHLTTKAERRVEKAFVKDIKKVSGKTNLLFRLAEAAVDKPDGTVRDVVFPVVSEQTDAATWSKNTRLAAPPTSSRCRRRCAAPTANITGAWCRSS
jgi:hypothetical protein